MRDAETEYVDGEGYFYFLYCTSKIFLDVYIIPKTLVFVNSKRMTNKLAIELSLHGIKSWSINSDRPLELRKAALDAFNDDPYSRVMVATDILSRGHNIKHLSHVCFAFLKRYLSIKKILGR